MKFNSFTILIVLGLLISCSDATLAPQAEKRFIDKQFKHRKLLRAISTDADFRKYSKLCPANIYKTKPDNATSRIDCAADTSQCLASCKLGNADACFDLARVLETSANADIPDFTYPLFSAACEAGDGNACVNAGAAVKNGVWLGDKPTISASAECQFNTYKKMCDEDMVWGCFMVGYEYSRSNGAVPQSSAKADAAWRKACRLAPNNNACRSGYR